MERIKDKNNFRWYKDPETEELYISPTTVLSCVQHFRFTNWLKNNSKNKIEKRSNETANLGTELHRLVELDLNQKIPGEIIPSALVRPLQNWVDVKNEYKLEALMTETTVVSKKYGYAGTLDMLVSGDFKKQNKPFAIGDLKSGNYSIKAGWQIAAYWQAVIEGNNAYTPDNLGMIGIQVHRDGSTVNVFEYQHIDFCLKRFLYALELFKGLYYNSLKAMEWKYLNEDSLEKFFGVVDWDQYARENGEWTSEKGIDND